MAVKAKTKAKIELVILACIILFGGAFGGLWLADNYMSIPPILIALVVIGAMMFAGLGKGIYSLANALNYNCPKLYAYLPFTQDVVVYSVVKSMRRQTSLKRAVTKFNLLLVSTILIAVDIFAVIGNSILEAKLLEQAQDEATIQKILNIHTGLLIVIGVTCVLALIIRTIYFEYIFKLVYKNPILCVLGAIPPIQIIMIALLHNQLGYIRHQHDKRKAQSNMASQQQRHQQPRQQVPQQAPRPQANLNKQQVQQRVQNMQQRPQQSMQQRPQQPQQPQQRR